MKKAVALFIISFVLLFSCVTILSCDSNLQKHKIIKYEVTGSANSVSITMSNKNGNTEQISSVVVPWELSFSVDIEKDSYYFAYVSAQNNGKSGSVIAKIYVDEKEFRSSTSTGDYVIATASGSVK